MKAKLFIGLLTAWVLAACGDDSAAFYTTSYPIVRIEAVVTLDEPEPEPENPEPENPEPENPEPENPTPEATQQENPENLLIQQIKEEVLAAAPVQAGGRYVLEFTQHNGGSLIIYPTAESQPLKGSFIKEPDKPKELQFTFGDFSYTCTASNYFNGERQDVVLTVDLTEQYQALYPEAGITKVARQEYTSHPN